MINPSISSPFSMGISTIQGEPKWLSLIRGSELARFSEMGLPSIKQENWRFTNVKPIADISFQPASCTVSGEIEAEAMAQFPFPKCSESRMVFLNGCFSSRLSSVGPQTAGIKILSLADALVNKPAFVERHFSHFSQAHATSFTSLNTALFQDGALVHVPEGVIASRPVHLVHVFSRRGFGEAVYPRHLIVVERGARLTITESYVGVHPDKYFTNGVTELIVDEGAEVEYLKFQNESPKSFHLATVATSLGRASRVQLHSIAFGAKLSRTNIHVLLKGGGAECLLNGLTIIGDEQLSDHYTIVDHSLPHGTTREYFNGILSDKSKGVFHGRIIVRPHAQRTDAKQTNKNILLSDGATVDSKPQLEIYADDVKCTHGATVGQLSEEAIFYLRSRAISQEQARQMLLHAFAQEIIDRIQCEALRQELNEWVSQRLKQDHFTESSLS